MTPRRRSLYVWYDVVYMCCIRYVYTFSYTSRFVWCRIYVMYKISMLYIYTSYTSHVYIYTSYVYTSYIYMYIRLIYMCHDMMTWVMKLNRFDSSWEARQGTRQSHAWRQDKSSLPRVLDNWSQTREAIKTLKQLGNEITVTMPKVPGPVNDVMRPLPSFALKFTRPCGTRFRIFFGFKIQKFNVGI